MPIQRSLRISLTSSFDVRCSAETAGGFCCLRDIKRFPTCLITVRGDCCSACRTKAQPLLPCVYDCPLARYLCCPRAAITTQWLSLLPVAYPGKIGGKSQPIRRQRCASALPPRSRAERPVTAGRWRAGLRTAGGAARSDRWETQAHRDVCLDCPH